MLGYGTLSRGPISPMLLPSRVVATAHGAFAVGLAIVVGSTALQVMAMAMAIMMMMKMHCYPVDYWIHTIVGVPVGRASHPPFEKNKGP